MNSKALPIDDDDVLTKQDLAEFLDVSERTIERWIVERTIPFIVLPQRGRRCNIRFLRSTVIIWLKRNEKKASNKLLKEVMNDQEENKEND
jgi:excisionase family DNA binding protein